MSKDKSIFLKFFENHSLIKILDFFILFRDFSYTKKEIAKYSGVNWNSFLKVWPKLIEEKMIIFTKIIKNNKSYKLNLRNKLVRQLIRVDNLLCGLKSKKWSN